MHKEHIQTLRNKCTRVHTNTRTDAQEYIQTLRHRCRRLQGKVGLKSLKGLYQLVYKYIGVEEKTFSSSSCFKKHSCLGVAVNSLSLGVQFSSSRAFAKD